MPCYLWRIKRFLHLSAVAGLLVVSACGADSDGSTDSEPTISATEAATTTEAVPDTEAPTTTEAGPAELDARALTEILASDELAGRDNRPDGFNDEAVGLLLLGAVGFVSALTELPCLPVN